MNLNVAQKLINPSSEAKSCLSLNELAGPTAHKSAT